MYLAHIPFAWRARNVAKARSGRLAGTTEPDE